MKYVDFLAPKLDFIKKTVCKWYMAHIEKKFWKFIVRNIS